MFFRVAPTCASATNGAARRHIGKRLFVGCGWVERTARATWLFLRSRATGVASLSPSRSQCLLKSLKNSPLWLRRSNGHSSFARETKLTVWLWFLCVEFCGVISFTRSSRTAGSSGRLLLPKVRRRHRKFGRLWARLWLCLAYGVCYLKTGYVGSWSEHTNNIFITKNTPRTKHLSNLCIKWGRCLECGNT